MAEKRTKLDIETMICVLLWWHGMVCFVGGRGGRDSRDRRGSEINSA